MQYRLVELLRPFAEGMGVVAAEVPFRALTEYEVRAADVAFVSQSRWDATAEDDYLRGSPELIVEVLSRSNTTAEMREKAALYLATGCLEFWVVDPGRRGVSVTRRDGENLVIRPGMCVPLAMLGAEIAVGRIFD